MAKRDRQRLLREFKQAKRTRTAEDAEHLLDLFGFVKRAATKEGSVWNRGRVGLTLPSPKGQFLLVPYVVLVIRKIEEAERAGIPEEKIS